MNRPDIFDRVPADLVAMGVYGEPMQVDGATVIPVARIGRGYRATPVGVYVIHDGDVTWSPAVDHNRVALIGVITGLAAAVIGTLAMLRRPPWPDVVLSGQLPDRFRRR
jgi:hypothetical protein